MEYLSKKEKIKRTTKEVILTSFVVIAFTIFLMCLFLVSDAQAAVILDEDFDSYTAGHSIITDGDWLYWVGATRSWSVLASGRSAPNSIKATSTTAFQNYINFATSSDVSARIYFYIPSNGNQYSSLGFSQDDDAYVGYITIYALTGSVVLQPSGDGMITGLSTATWHYVDLGLSDGNFTASINGGGVSTTAASATPTNAFFITNGNGYNYLYYDDLIVEDNTATTECSEYLTEEECTESENCSWWTIGLENPYLYQNQIFGICVATENIPEGFSTTTYAYTDQTTCENLGYCWYEGSGCYVCDESMTTTSDFAYTGDIKDFITNPGKFLASTTAYFDLRKKFPVGWLYEIYSTWTSTTAALSAASSSAAKIYNLEVPIGEWATATITFINFEWLTDGAFGSIHSTLYELTTYAIWFAFGWKMWRKIMDLGDKMNKQETTGKVV